MKEPSENPSSTGPEAEAFIPFLFDDLIEMCLCENRLPAESHQDFREFCSFFAASGNYISHRDLEGFDKDYAYFNPDSEMKVVECQPSELKAAEERVVSVFRTVATNANYRKLSQEEIEASFHTQSLIKLRTDVDLDEFTQVECFVRGGDIKTQEGRDWKFKKVEHKIDIWRRVLLLMQFKKDSELTAEQLKRRQKTGIAYQPGKIYVYQYKDVPRPDLEILFPNVRVSMNSKDRIMLSVPALAAAVVTILKVGVKIAFIAGVIAFVFFGKEMFGFEQNNATDLMKVAVTVLGVLVAFGGLGFKQYTSVKNKRIGFLKEVSEHLFFRNIAMNKSVFDRIIDDGEDEDSKEAMLIYYHLLTHTGSPLTREQLDTKIQDWMKERFDTVIDFDIDGPVEKLKRFEGVTNRGEKKTLLTESAEGLLEIPTLDDAKEILDYHWDNAFQYSNKREQSPLT